MVVFATTGTTEVAVGSSVLYEVDLLPGEAEQRVSMAFKDQTSGSEVTGLVGNVTHAEPLNFECSVPIFAAPGSVSFPCRR